MEIDLLNTKIYIICDENLFQYNKKYDQLYTNLVINGFNINNIENIQFTKSIARTHLQIYEKVLEYNFEPFFIIHLDCNINKINNTKLIIKKNTDAILLAISKYNLSAESYINELTNLKIKSIDDTFFQVFNMMCSDSILYCNRNFVKFIYKYLYDIYIVNNSYISFNVYIAKLQSLKTFYALKEPIFYNNDTKSTIYNISYQTLTEYKPYLLTYQDNLLLKQIGDIQFYKHTYYSYNEIAFVTNYFNDSNEDNQIISNLLQNLNHPLILYTDSNSYKKLKQIRGYLMNKTEIIYTTKENYDYKLDYIKECYDNNYFGSNYYIWIDIDIIKDRNLINLLKHYPDIEKIKKECNDKITLLNNNSFDTRIVIYHKNSIDTLYELTNNITNVLSENELYENLYKHNETLFNKIKIDKSNCYNTIQKDLSLFMFNNFMPIKPIVSSVVMGGLCNQLFQVLMTYTYAQRYDSIYMIDTKYIIHNPHSNKNYMQSIFNKQCFTFNQDYSKIIREHPKKCLSYEEYDNKKRRNIVFQGYYQTEKYFEENIKFIEDILNLEPYLQDLPIYKNTIFLHIRLGDYVNHSFHDVKLFNNFYYNALKHFENMNQEIQVKVFSNNIEQSKQLFNCNEFKLQFEFVDEQDEIKALIMMSKCHLGGIGSNSSYSWFGNLFNRNPHKLFILPNKWFNDETIPIKDMYPKSNCLILDV